MHHRTNHTPSLREIKEACLEIQKGWSERERRGRAAHAKGRIEWLLPRANTRSIPRVKAES